MIVAILNHHEQLSLTYLPILHRYQPFPTIDDESLLILGGINIDIMIHDCHYEAKLGHD